METPSLCASAFWLYVALLPVSFPLLFGALPVFFSGLIVFLLQATSSRLKQTRHNTANVLARTLWGIPRRNFIKS